MRINGTGEMRGTGNIGVNNNGSIKLGGGSAYTTNYYYDDVAIDGQAYPPVAGLVNYVNLETGDFSQSAAHTGGAIVTSPALDGTYSLQLQRSGSVANYEIREGGTNYYNLSTAYYSFLFEYTSNPSEGGIVNFQDTASGYKAALHLSAAGKLLFYDNGGHLVRTGATSLVSGQIYTIGAIIGTGTTATWEIFVNARVDMSSLVSGTANLGTINNGSIKLGGSSPYTTNYYYDDVAISSLASAGGPAAPLAPSSTALLVSQFQVVNLNPSLAGTPPSFATVTSPPHDPPVILHSQSPLPSVGQNTGATADRVKARIGAVHSVFSQMGRDPAHDALSDALAPLEIH